MEITCKWCGKVFVKSDSFVSGQRKAIGENACRFCSNDCAREYRKSLHWEKRTCSYCGKEYLFELNQKDRPGRGQYCSKKCHYAAGHFTKKCETCGKEFSGLKFFENVRRFCSTKCAGTEPLKVELTCVICGKKYERIKSHSSTSKCCSWKCNHALKVKNRPVLVCAHCGKDFVPAYPSYIKRYGDKPACSMRCAAELRRKHNPIKRGELNRTEWHKIRASVIERDGGVCARCGSAFNLSVHHIIPYRIVKHDNPDNLITLCRKCHGKIDQLTEKYFPL